MRSVFILIKIYIKHPQIYVQTVSLLCRQNLKNPILHKEILAIEKSQKLSRAFRSGWENSLTENIWLLVLPKSLVGKILVARVIWLDGEYSELLYLRNQRSADDDCVPTARCRTAPWLCNNLRDRHECVAIIMTVIAIKSSIGAQNTIGQSTIV